MRKFSTWFNAKTTGCSEYNITLQEGSVLGLWVNSIILCASNKTVFTQCMCVHFQIWKCTHTVQVNQLEHNYQLPARKGSTTLSTKSWFFLLETGQGLRTDRE